MWNWIFVYFINVTEIGSLAGARSRGLCANCFLGWCQVQRTLCYLWRIKVTLRSKKRRPTGPFCDMQNIYGINWACRGPPTNKCNALEKVRYILSQSNIELIEMYSMIWRLSRLLLHVCTGFRVWQKKLTWETDLRSKFYMFLNIFTTLAS